MSAAAAGGWALLATALLIAFSSFFVRGEVVAPIDIARGAGAQAAAYLLALFLILRVHAPTASIRDVIAFRPGRLIHYPLAAVCGLAAAGPMTLLYVLVERRFPENPELGQTVERAVASASLVERVLLGFVIVALAPLIEEVFFRGALYGELRRRYAPWSAAFTTALLFGIVHVFPQQLPSLIIVGLVLAAFRHASGSIGPPTLLHAAFNGAAFFNMVVGVAEPPPKLDGPIVLQAGIALAVAALSLGTSLWIGRRPRSTQPPRSSLRPPPPSIPPPPANPKDDP